MNFKVFHQAESRWTPSYSIPHFLSELINEPGSRFIWISGSEPYIWGPSSNLSLLSAHKWNASIISPFNHLYHLLQKKKKMVPYPIFYRSLTLHSLISIWTVRCKCLRSQHLVGWAGFVQLKRCFWGPDRWYSLCLALADDLEVHRIRSIQRGIIALPWLCLVAQSGCMLIMTLFFEVPNFLLLLIWHCSLCCTLTLLIVQVVFWIHVRIKYILIIYNNWVKELWSDF